MHESSTSSNKRRKLHKMKTPGLSIVVAMAANGRGIGREGNLPWRLANDLKFFKDITMKTKSENGVNAVVMGRKTWNSIPKKFRPLPGRFNVVLSKSATKSDLNIAPTDDVEVASSFTEALSILNKSDKNIENVFVIGGASIYREALQRKDCETIYLTEVKGDGFRECDVFFPEIDENEFRCIGNPSDGPEGIQEENGIQYEFLQYVRSTQKGNRASPDPALEAGSPVHGGASSLSVETKPAPRHEEYQYLEMVRHVLENGHDKGDRTGTGTLSTFGTTMRFSLRDDTIPLLTTKRVFWRGVAEELLWFISGCTSAKVLQEKGIRIWDGNGSREYLDKLGLTDREEGDLGPVYGFQWRHFGAEYKTMHDNYDGQGVDQLAQLIHTIKTNPNDRRMILSAWNPAAFHLMALPPCHMFAQFYVANGELSCQMYQRSADMGLGVPFNIASYSLLTHLIAKCTGLKAGEFIHVIGDCHVYKDHVEPLKEQITRTPGPFPKLKINTTNTDIDGFKFEDFELIGYNPQNTIKMKMSV